MTYCAALLTQKPIAMSSETARSPSASSVTFDDPASVAAAAVNDAESAAAPLVPARASSVQPLAKAGDLMSEDAIGKLGGDAAQSLEAVSTRLLAVQRMGDAGELGQQLNQLIAEAKGLDPNSMAGKGIVGRIFGAFGNTKEKILGHYDTVQHRIDTLVGQIGGEMTVQTQRMKDLDDLALALRAYHDSLEQAVAQGKAGLAAFDAEIARRGAEAAGDAFEAAAIDDLRDRRNTLDKRVDDFQRNLVFITQTLPSILLMKQNARDLVSTFNDIKVTTIPVWRGVFSQYLISLDQKRGAALMNEVRDATNEAIRKQAEQLGQNAAAIATARQRSSIDLETLQYNQTKLLETLDEVVAIEKKGRADRDAAKPQIAALEQQIIKQFSQPHDK